MSEARILEARLALAAASLPRVPCVADRMARLEPVAPALAVAGARPQLAAIESADDRAADDAKHDHWSLIVEPHEMGRARPKICPDRAVIAIRHPRLTRGGALDPTDEFGRVIDVQSAPAGLPVNPVELDQG